MWVNVIDAQQEQRKAREEINTNQTNLRKDAVAGKKYGLTKAGRVTGSGKMSCIPGSRWRLKETAV